MKLFKQKGWGCEHRHMIKDKERATIITVAETQRELSEKAKITAQESIEIAQQNKERQVIVAMWNKEKIYYSPGSKNFMKNVFFIFS